MKKCLLTFVFLCLVLCGWSQSATRCVFVVMTDGWRWQELFNGASDTLMSDKQFVQAPEALKKQFGEGTSQERRKELMPFIWTEFASHGQLYGNRTYENKFNVSNSHHFSYPGYSEVICGFADNERVNSNEKVPNPNVNIFEYLNKKPEFRNKIAVFGSWDLFPYIFNENRSHLPVNAGYALARGGKISHTEDLLNKMQFDVPGQWTWERYDVFTNAFAQEYIKREKPRIVFISFGDTDEFAHAGKYDSYLEAGHRVDQYLKELWNFINHDSFYKGKTTLIFTTDHGRGKGNSAQWRDHGANIPGSNQNWMAIMGPDTPALGEIKENSQHYSNQIAQTIARLLNTTYVSERESGPYIKSAF